MVRIRTSEQKARHAEQMRAYRKTERGKAVRNAHAKKWQALNRSIVKANKLLQTAVVSGKVIRPDTCSQCGNKGSIQGHHDDYSKPLDVRWLCVRCHLATHGKRSYDN